MKVYSLNITDLTDEELSEFSKSMGDERRAEISRIKNPDSAKQKITADYLCRKAVSEFSSVSANDIIIKKTASGKPYAENARAEFSISHSKEIVACAVSENEIGIDAEKIRSVNFRAAARFATEEEIAYIGESIERFFEIWTLKEAYFKCIGTGLGADIKNVSFRIENGVVECSEKGFECSFYPLKDGYCCSICEKIRDCLAKRRPKETE